MAQKSQSILINALTAVVEFGNSYLTLGSYLFRRSERVFQKIEIMLVTILILCGVIWLQIDKLPFYFGLVICILLAQRILEYLIVYSRNFILNKGRVFTHFSSNQQRGQWLIAMFFLNVLQTVLIFATWYRFVSINEPSAFSQPLTVLDSLYYSLVTFLTVGYGDIVPTIPLTKIMAMMQGLMSFYTVVIVINGLISIHFRDPE